jgi:hypothetical protein
MGSNTWQWLHAVFSSPQAITRIVYQNFFDTVPGSNTAGVMDFSLWAGNDGVNWTQLITSQGTFDQHVNNDQADARSINVDNAVAYTHFIFYLVNGYGASLIGMRRIELQTTDGGVPTPPPGGTIPTVTTAGITAITAGTATGGGNVTSDGGLTVTARGICWNTTGNPTTSDSKTSNGTGTGSFTSSLTGLTAPTTYYVRAYATNSKGTSYGAETSFSTIALPTVTTTSPASKIKSTSAIVRAEIVSTGGVAPTARGVCWNTTGSPTTADSKVSETGTFAIGTFAEALSGLTRATLYHARAYATNSEGTAYGAEITFTTLSIESIADPQPTLTDTFYLPRAGRYSNPQNTNDTLPFPYGDLTDGTAGVWTLPYIDTVNFVYCFAAFPVLSVANGNSINIYADGVLVNPVNYSFDEDDDYEGEGHIAKITFTSDQANATITARGKGKALTGATLMENIIDIVFDFLTVQNNFTADLFDSTRKAMAALTFNTQGYQAAGVITEDGVFWDIVTGMMASFLGSAYLSGNGDLALDIDNGDMSLYGATIIRKSDAELKEARQRLVNIINQCPAHYAYNYDEGTFKQETNTAAHVNVISQGIHGVREPNEPLQLYWCRNLSDAQAVQDIIVNKLKDPIYEIEIEDKSLKHLHLDVGDYFVNSIDSLYDKEGSELFNHIWKVISVRPDFSKALIALRALQTPYFLTTAFLLDGSFELDGSVKLGSDRDTVIY